MGVQKLSCNGQTLFAMTVERITDDGMFVPSEVNSNLMGSSGKNLDL